MNNFPAVKAFAASLAYFGTHAGTILKILWLPTLILTALNVYAMPAMFDAQFALMEAEEAGDPDAVIAAMAPILRVSGLLYLAAAIFYPMMLAGVLRHLIRGQAPKLPFNISFGMDELNIILGTILVSLVIFAAVFIGMIGFAIIAGVLGALLSGVAPVLSFVAIFAGLVVFIGALGWFSIRLSLVYPAAIGERKVGVAESWNMSRGHVWGLAGYWALWGLASMVLLGIFIAVFMAGYIPLMIELFGSIEDTEAVNEINLRMMEESARMWDISTPMGLVLVAVSYVATMITTALYAIPSGMAYRFLAEGRE